MSEQAASHGRGKRVNAASMLARMPDVPLDRLTPGPVGEGGSAEPIPHPAPTPSAAAASRPAVRSAARRKSTARAAGKPTALKLPPALTSELRGAMVYLRGHGTWDASMSSIAQAGIRYELDRLKMEFGIDAFPPVD